MKNMGLQMNEFSFAPNTANPNTNLVDHTYRVCNSISIGVSRWRVCYQRGFLSSLTILSRKKCEGVLNITKLKTDNYLLLENCLY